MSRWYIRAASVMAIALVLNACGETSQTPSPAASLALTSSVNAAQGKYWMPGMVELRS